MNLSSMMKAIGKHALILLVGIALGYALLVLVFLLPTAPMQANLSLSEVTFNGEWGSAEDSYHQLFKSYPSTQLDNSTDALMLVSATTDSDESVWMRAANVYSSHRQAYFALRDGLSTSNSTASNTAYTRYWHGYMVTLKPLLLFFTYMDLRMINAMVQGILLVLIVLGMQKRNLGRYLPAFLLSLIGLTPFVIPFSLQFSTCFYLLCIAMILLLYCPKFVWQRLTLPTFFLIVGMATSYFDFLTYPLATFGMPCCLFLLLTPEDEDQTLFKRFCLITLAWGVGYVGMWAGKWVIGALFSGDPYWWYNIEAILLKRSSRSTMEASFSILDILKTVLSPFLKKPYLLAFASAFLAFVFAFFAGNNQKKPLPLQRLLVFLLLMISPFVWYFFTGNHTYNHAFFTSRALAVFFFGGACLATRLCEKQSTRI